MKSALRTPNAAPRGMWFERLASSKRPWVARWRIAGEKRARSFASEKERDDFAAEWSKLRAKNGATAASVSPAELETWREFSRITAGARPLDVAREWLQSRGFAAQRPVLSRAIALYAEAREAQELARDSVTHRDLHLSRLLGFFGDKRIDLLTAEILREWIDQLKDGDQPMAPKTRAHHRATVNRLLSHAAAERWIDRNPCDAVPVPSGGASDEVNILTVAQTIDLFEANIHAACIGRLALEAFGGLRNSSASRIAFADIDLHELGFTMPARKHKSGRRHYVDGFESNLWEWLRVAPPSCWQISPRAYLDEKRMAFERAGLKPPTPDDGPRGENDLAQLASMRNALRHSFATYHVAAFKDASRTAVLLTHRSPSMLYQHYKGRATAADGKRYFEISP